MALSATFTANFSSFYEAVDKAEVKLKEFGGGAEKAGTKLNAMAQQFSGQKIIQEATLMAKAIGDVENYARLTDKELAKVAATATEAVAKLKKLGQEVPKDIQQMADATKGANKASIDWLGSLTKIAGAVGIAFSVDAVVDFVGEMFSAASAVKDTSLQWGISMKAVQQWTAAAKLSGVEAQTLGGAIQFMTAQMAEGSDLFKAQLEQLGITYDTFKKLSIEDQTRQLMEAVKGIKDETLLLDVATGIWGPNAKKMIGAVKDEFIKAGDALAYVKDETIEKLAAAEAKWKWLKDQVKIYSTEMVAALGDNIEQMMTKWGGFFSYVAAGLSDAMGGGRLLPALITQQMAVSGLEQETKSLIDQTLALGHASTGTGKKIKTKAELEEEARKKTEALRKAESERNRVLDEAKRAEEAVTRELKKHDDALDDLVNSFGGAGGSGAIGKANLYLEALKQAIPIEQMSATAKLNIHKAMDEAIVSYQAAGQMAPKVMYDIWLATKNATEGVIEFSSKWKNFADLVNTQPIDLGKGFAMAPPPELTPWKDAFTDFADTLPAIFGAAMSARGAGMGKVLGEQLGAGIAAAITPAIAKAMGGNNAAAGLGVATVTQMFSEVFRNILEARNAAERFQIALRNMTTDMHADLVGPNSPYEDFEDLEAAANELGLTFADVWNPDGVNTFGYHLQERIDEFELLRDAAEKWKREVTGAIDELGVALEDFGGTVPASLQPMIDSLLEIQGIPPDIAALLGGLAEDPSWQTMQARAQALGVDLAALGPKFQESRIHDIAFGYLHDLEMLAGEGSNVVLVLDGMKDELSTLYQDAQATGVKLPETLRPYMQRLVEMGALVDKNGKAVTELTDDMFADVEDKGLSAIVKILEQIKELLEKGLPSAAESGAKDVAASFARHPVVVPYSFEQQGGGPDTSSPGPPEYAQGTGGFVNFGKGTPVILHGWEAVVPRDAANATVSGGGGAASLGGGMMTVIVEADGRQISRIVAPYLPGEVRRLGLARG